MSLSEMISQAGLALYPTVALVLFLAAFAGVVGYVACGMRGASYERAPYLPLDDGERHGND